MGRANKQAGAALTGVLVIDKPVGISSMVAVARVRSRAGGTKTGHAGTLDPLASGVLVMALGPATKSIDRFMATDKRYRTVVDLGAFTETDDLEGDRVEVIVAEPPTEQAVRAAVEQFVGPIMQRPPARSAVKIGGQRAYKLSRRGEDVNIPPRSVTVHDLEVIRYVWPLLELEVSCGKGTYIRSLARDLGEALGTGGHCRAIRRTAVGPFTEEEAVRVDELPDPLEASDLISLEDALRRVE